MMNATSPAAKISPMHTEATSARDTSTSALMSKAVTRPMMASRMMGRPHSTMATHARSKGRGCHFSKLSTTATPEITSSTMSFLMPSSSRNASNVSVTRFMYETPFYTPLGIPALYT